MEVKGCPHCGGTAELTFKLPVFGWGGCKIKCLCCGAEMQDTKFTEQKFDENTKTLSTSATPESIAACIERTVAKWNRRA